MNENGLMVVLGGIFGGHLMISNCLKGVILLHLVSTAVWHQEAWVSSSLRSPVGRSNSSPDNAATMYLLNIPTILDLIL